jgi:Do/DeqQ family serine protease
MFMCRSTGKLVFGVFFACALCTVAGYAASVDVGLPKPSADSLQNTNSSNINTNSNVGTNINTTNNVMANATLAPMLSKVLPALVNLSVRGELPPMRVPVIDQQMQRRSIEVAPKFEDLGSGVIVDAQKGYVLTNAHVIKDAQYITATLKDGRKMHAKVIGSDQQSDIAVLQIEAKRLSQIVVGDSDKLNIGDFVSAIGSPFGLQQTVTSGVISGLERNNFGLEGNESFIQTDAPINPGNSGGALVNMRGELIGINTALITTSPTGGSVGVGLAVPSSMARSVMEQLIKYGKVERSMVGVLVQDITPALVDVMHLPNTDGALVSQVMPDMPAARAGVKSKDVIVSVMDKAVRSAVQLKSAVSMQRAGSKIKLTVWRDKKFVTVDVIGLDQEKVRVAQKEVAKPLLAGLELISFDELVDNEHIKGVEVSYVDDNSAAYSCGLRSGDVILSAAGQPVNAVDALQGIAAKNPKQLLLEVKRKLAGNIFLVLEV